MRHILTILSTFLLPSFCAIALDLGGQNRQDISLNEGWGYHSIFEVAKKAPFEPVTLPHTWNVRFIPGTVRYDRAMNVYNRTLTITPDMQGKRLFLYFEGVNSVASVFINRHIVGEHKGGYLAFCYEITDFVKQGDNLLEVWASNAFRTDVLPISGDFNVYGGIHRPCHLIVTERDCIRPDFYASPGVLIRQSDVSVRQADLDIEAFLSLKDYPKEYEIVMPSVSVLAEPSVAIVDKIVDKRNTRKLATEYLNYLYSDEAQLVAAKHHYRPTNKAILDEYKEFDQNVNLITIEHFGGWENAQKTHFSEYGIFDQIYEKN